MSYCGACASFYNPACMRWPQCAPAPNPHEERNANLTAMAAEASARVAGMIAENQQRVMCGEEATYGERAFAEIADSLLKELGLET